LTKYYRLDMGLGTAAVIGPGHVEDLHCQTCRDASGAFIPALRAGVEAPAVINLGENVNSQR